MERIGEGIFQVAEVPYFVQSVIDEEQESESEAQDQGGYVEAGFRILRRQEFIHVPLEFEPKIKFFGSCAPTCKKMLILAVIHRCLERSLAKDKIIRTFNTLLTPGENNKSNNFPVKYTALFLF